MGRAGLQAQGFHDTTVLVVAGVGVEDQAGEEAGLRRRNLVQHLQLVLAGERSEAPCASAAREIVERRQPLRDRTPEIGRLLHGVLDVAGETELSRSRELPASPRGGMISSSTLD